MNRPLESEYAPFYQGYVAHVSEDEILPVLRSQVDALDVLLNRLAADLEPFRYADGKWSIREVIGHLIDAERVFGYRAFSIARGEQKNLPGFDEKEYMLSAPYDRIDLEDLLSELRLVRLSNIAMLRKLDSEAWLRAGISNDSPVSVRALAFIIAGPNQHYLARFCSRDF